MIKSTSKELRLIRLDGQAYPQHVQSFIPNDISNTGGINRKQVLDYWGKVQNFKTRTTRTPAFWGYPRRFMITHTSDYWVILDPKSKDDKVKVTNLKILPKFQFFKFWNKHYTRHTVRSCLIRCANMKWIRRVLLKIQSGHDSVHRRTDGQTDGRTDRWTKWNQYTPIQLRWKEGL